MKLQSDFLRVLEGAESTGSWGQEEVVLYRQFLRSSLKVVRATDPGIFHLWHPKVCSGSHQSEQFRACLRAKALTEGSHGQLGALAFRGREAELTPPETPAKSGKRGRKQLVTGGSKRSVKKSVDKSVKVKEET